MPTVRDDALILRRFSFGETSLVVQVLTREHGRVHLIARGAYRPKSRYYAALDLFDTPPADAMLAPAEGGAPAALGFFVVVEPDASLDFDAENFDDGRIVGGSETHVIIYADETIDAQSPWGRYLGSGFDPGFHVLEVVDGGKECDGPDGECAYYPDTLVPADGNLEAEIVLHLAPFDEVEWPAIG